MNNPTVSVIITTKNEEKNIENCLESIKNQTYLKNYHNHFLKQSGVEIIVVDNNSTDKTKEIACRYTDKVYNCGPNRAAQLNFGVNISNGKYIIFPDADMILSEHVISECVEKCIREDLVALYIPEEIIGKGFWIKVRVFERIFYNVTCIDAVRFVKKENFLEIGGFDKDLYFGPDDWDFDKKIRNRGRVDIIRAPIYHNEGEFNLKNYLKKKAYYIQSFDKYIKKWSKNDPDIKKQVGFYYRFIGVFIENGKWKRLIKHPILTFGMYTLRFLVGLQYLIYTRG